MRVFLVTLAMVLLLFLGIFIGVNWADEAIQEVQGHKSSPEGLQLIRQPDGSWASVTLLGKTITREQFQKLQNTPQDAEEAVPVGAPVQKEDQEAERNRFAELGSALSRLVESLTRGVMELLMTWIDSLV